MADFAYNGWSLSDAIDALFAYDGGATDSGVRDEAMKAAVREHLGEMADTEMTRFLGKYARKQFLSKQAMDQGYGLADVKEFLDWLSSEMGIDY